MATQIQRRRGTTANHASFVGAQGELTVDTTKNTVVVHDGATAGGFPLAKESALGTIASQNANAVNITGGAIAGITDLAIADGGTGASTAANARTNLGLGTAATQNVGTAANNVVQLDGTARLPAVDGSQLTGLPSTKAIPVRQTVLGGPVDSGGLPSFLPATSGSLTLTAQNISATAPFVAAAANGFSSNGAVDRIGQTTSNSLSWTLNTNVTNYLYVDIDSAGNLTAGSTTLAPTYQWGGARSTTNGQATFNIQAMSMTVGNGSVANQTWRVFVGEADTNATTATATRAYAYQGRYDSGWTNTLPGLATQITRAANIGVVPEVTEVTIRCLTAEGGFSVGDQTKPLLNHASGITSELTTFKTMNNVGFVSGASVAVAVAQRPSGPFIQVTAANWAYKITANRGW